MNTPTLFSLVLFVRLTILPEIRATYRINQNVEFNSKTRNLVSVVISCMPIHYASSICHMSVIKSLIIAANEKNSN